MDIVSIVNGGAQKADLVESAVAQLIAALCLQQDLPEFVDSMIRTKWRVVMFLVGLNKGTASIEWIEAKHTASMLTAAISGNIALRDRDRKEIFDQLRHGFTMVQMDLNEQNEFMEKLVKQFDAQTENLETCVLIPDSSREDSKKASREASKESSDDKPPEASISPTGEEIIDQSDLDEIAQLLGSDGSEEDGKLDEIDLLELQTDIDQLENNTAVQYLINGSYEDCTLARTSGDAELYRISNGSGFSLDRSRLGLAIALQNGEFKIPGYELAALARQKTLLPTSIIQH